MRGIQLGSKESESRQQCKGGSAWQHSRRWCKAEFSRAAQAQNRHVQGMRLEGDALSLNNIGQLFLQSANITDDGFDLRFAKLALVGWHLVFALGNIGNQVGVRGLNNGRILE